MRDGGPVEMTVGMVANLVGVSVRTLHHWDEIGLVSPSSRSWGGYRLYSNEDIAHRYVTKAHLADRFDSVEPGLAAWMKEVVDANAKAHGVDPAQACWA